MKRIIALLLVLATVFCLVGCNEDLLEQIKNHRGEYDYEPPVVEEMTLNVYIVCDQATQSAQDAVARQINLYTEDKFKTKLNIHYVPSSEYETTVNANLDTADLILITNKAMMEQLVNDGKVADLTEFFNSEKYGTLNVEIASALLEASKLPAPAKPETPPEGEGEGDGDGEGDGIEPAAEEETTPTEMAYFAVPNNRVVGTYTYLCVNKQTVHHELKYPLNPLEDFPYVYALSMGTDKANVARLVRSLMLRDLIATKDPDAVAKMQANLFNQLVVTKFISEYPISEQNYNQTKTSTLGLLALLTEEQVAEVRGMIQLWHDETYPEEDPFAASPIEFVSNTKANANDYEKAVATKIHASAWEVYKKYNFNYGIEDPNNPSDPPLKPYPSAADLVSWYLSTRKNIDDSGINLHLVVNGPFTKEEIDVIYNYRVNATMYLEAAKGESIDMSAYAGYDAVLLSGAMYEDKAAIEAAGWVCNVVEAPTVSADDAFASAFAVIKHGEDEAAQKAHADRVMEIIYAFNTDTYLHNLLLYGVENMNYNLVDGNVTLYGTDYRMNPLYTGNLFTSYFCEEYGYTKEVAQYGELQNKDAVVYVDPNAKSSD